MGDFYLNKMSCYNLLMKVAISRMERMKCVVIHVRVKLSMCIWILFRLKVSYSIQSTKNRNTLNNLIWNSSQIGHSEFHKPHNYHTPHFEYIFILYVSGWRWYGNTVVRCETEQWLQSSQLVACSIHLSDNEATHDWTPANQTFTNVFP